MATSSVIGERIELIHVEDSITDNDVCDAWCGVKPLTEAAIRASGFGALYRLEHDIKPEATRAINQHWRAWWMAQKDRWSGGSKESAEHLV